MRIREFVEAVRSYGVMPVLTSTGSLNTYYEDLIGVDHPGTGYQRTYSQRHVRRLVSWLLIGLTTGNDRGADSPLRHEAMRLLAAAPEGWVVLADGRVWWSLAPPVATLRSRCAVAIPVPEWRH